MLHMLPHRLSGTLQLYQALHPEDIQISEDDIGTVTVKNALLNQMYNDLGFTVGREDPKLLILLEAQSTWKEYLESREKEFLHI